MSKIGGPRCCKRNAFLFLATAVEFVNKKYGLDMEINDVKCDFSDMNKQCIKEDVHFTINRGLKDCDNILRLFIYFCENEEALKLLFPIQNFNSEYNDYYDQLIFLFDTMSCNCTEVSWAKRLAFKD